MFGLGLEVGERGLEVGLEGRRIGEVLEEAKAVVLEVGEGLLEIDLRETFGGAGVFGVHILWENMGYV